MVGQWLWKGLKALSITRPASQDQYNDTAAAEDSDTSVTKVVPLKTKLGRKIVPSPQDKESRKTEKELKSCPSFVHEELDRTKSEIRLLQLLPYTDGKVRCLIKNVSLDRISLAPGEESPVYTALSYTWGDEKANRYILINEKKFLVRTNLYNFLDTLSRIPKSSWQEKSGLLWIDALCIDQTNIKERNHQVGLMKSIYSGADKVLIWMGLDNVSFWIADPMKPGHRLLLKNHSLEEFENNNTTYPTTWGSTEMGQYRGWGSSTSGRGNYRAEDDLLESYDPSYNDYRDESYESQKKTYLQANKAVSKLCHHEYWRRVWIVQEVFFASDITIMMGNHFLPFETWFELTRCEKSSQSPGRVLCLWKYLNSTSKPPALLQALDNFSSQLSTERKDMLFGLLSIIDGGHNFPLDYHDEIEDIFWKAMKHFKDNYGGDALTAARALQKLLQMKEIPPVSKGPFPQLKIDLNVLERSAFDYFKVFSDVYLCTCLTCDAERPIFAKDVRETTPTNTRYVVCRFPSVDHTVLLFEVTKNKTDLMNDWKCIALGITTSSSTGKVSLTLHPPPGQKAFIKQRSYDSSKHVPQFFIAVDANVLREMMFQIWTSGKVKEYYTTPQGDMSRHPGAVWTTYKGSRWASYQESHR